MTGFSRLGVLLAACGSFPFPTGLAAQVAGEFEFDAARLMADVHTYHDFGVHRTAHAGDLRTSGEFRDLVEHGYRGLGIVGDSNPWFHVPGDDPRTLRSLSVPPCAR